MVKPRPVPPNLARRGNVGLGERFENGFDFVLGNADAGVGDGEAEGEGGIAPGLDGG